MKVLKTSHQKKSAAITTAIGILLLILFFTLGLRYLDPPIAYGMEVNFGTATSGSGLVSPPEPPTQQTTTPVAETTPEEEPVQENTPPPEPTPIVEEAEVLTEKESIVAVDSEEVKEPLPEPPKEEVAPVEEIPEPVKEIVETPEETPETPQEEIPPVELVEPKPQVSEATKNVLSGFLNNNKKSSEGEGDDAQAGDKGKQEGNPYANSYYSQAGLGGIGKGYGLNGRSLQSSGKVVQECNQEGIVVVRITVNRQGEVVQAEPGVKGSTNTHPCLLDPAQKTAALHRWHPDPEAPQKQIGFVVIQFKLGE